MMISYLLLVSIATFIVVASLVTRYYESAWVLWLLRGTTVVVLLLTMLQTIQLFHKT